MPDERARIREAMLDVVVARGYEGATLEEVLARGRSAANDAGSVEGLVPELMYLAVRPYLGEDAARE